MVRVTVCLRRSVAGSATLRDRPEWAETAMLQEIISARGNLTMDKPKEPLGQQAPHREHRREGVDKGFRESHVSIGLRNVANRQFDGH